MALIYALIDLSEPGIYKTPYFTLLYKPYYIGKGYSEDRPKQHFFESITRIKSKGKRSYKQNKIINLYKRNIEYSYIMFDCFDEDDSYNKESELIELFGRYSYGGILTNIQLGGLGSRKGYVHCKDKNGFPVYVKTTDKRIETGELIKDSYVVCVDENGNNFRIDKEQYDPNIHNTMHQGRKRSVATRKAISDGKKKYKFTEDHIRKIRESNKLTSKNIHTGAKRKESTKKAISKSRFGSNSKVASIWKLTDPDGNIFVYKGGIILAQELFDINANRLTRYEGKKVPYPNYTGHKNQRIFNTTGWKLEKNTKDEEITFEFVYFS